MALPAIVLLLAMLAAMLAMLAVLVVLVESVEVGKLLSGAADTLEVSPVLLSISMTTIGSVLDKSVTTWLSGSVERDCVESPYLDRPVLPVDQVVVVVGVDLRVQGLALVLHLAITFTRQCVVDV